MCGIAGFTAAGVNRIENPEKIIRDMIHALRPRGPDGEGFYQDDWVTLGHRRLSIIDIDGGAQPMARQEGRYQLVYNGELYNYLELRKELEEKGVSFSTHSDTEVLLHILMSEGMAGLSKCNGMFAFAFYDRDRKELFLARDRMGIKPLYYARTDGALVFASELKALREHPAFSRKMDLLSISKFMTFGYIPAPHTIYRDVFKVEPGFYLRFRGGECSKHKYWDIPLEDNPVSGLTVDQHAEKLIELLRDSVVKRLRSDVPVGVFLSGGIDSSLITALAAQSSSRKIHTFSVGFEESSYDESPYAREVAQRYDTEHHHEILSASRALRLLPEAMRILDEPFADASILPTFLLSRFTSEQVKVCLGGDGGDELFAGYPAFQAHKIMNALSFLPTTWRDGLVRAAKKIPVSHNYASVEFLLQQFFKGAGISADIRFFLWLGFYSHEQKKNLLTKEAQEELLRSNPFEDVLNYVRQSGLISDFPRILYLCSKLYLQDGILVKVDRASMANSLEVRVPFLDHHVVEYAAGIPSVYKLKGLTTKYILKKASKELLPRHIIHRRKAGFMIPLAMWLQKELRPWVEEVCSEEAIRQDGFFEYACVRQLLDEHFQSVRDNRKLIWPIFCFQLWRHYYG